MTVTSTLTAHVAPAPVASTFIPTTKPAKINLSATNPVAATSTPSMIEWSRMVFGRLSRQFEYSNGANAVKWAVETFGNGLSIGTGLGASGIVLMDMILRLQPEADIFYIDTGFFFPETHQLIERLEQRYQRRLRRVSTTLTIPQQDRRYGPRLHESDPNLCCNLRKVSPLHQALTDSTAWATALHRDQSETRKQVPMVQWNERYNVVKIAPLAFWSEADIWQYIHENGLPYNELHEKGYPSIGCWPCTRAVEAGESMRAGRWAGTEKTECGLHYQI